jgi:acyl CoA:acetate/3-ketoacid CoA transferase alpha subunit
LMIKMSENRDRNILVAGERCLDGFELIVDESTVDKSRVKCPEMALTVMMRW